MVSMRRHEPICQTYIDVLYKYQNRRFRAIKKDIIK